MECMHKTHSQKNEAMRKSYDRYAPKKKRFHSPFPWMDGFLLLLELKNLDT